MRYDSVPATRSSMIFEESGCSLLQEWRPPRQPFDEQHHSEQRLHEHRRAVHRRRNERQTVDIRDRNCFSSDYNLIANNGFYRIEGPAQLHAIYVIRSVGNEIRGNIFSNFSANLSTIKVRNYSLNTVIASNTFERAGTNAVIDAFCSQTEKNGECKGDDECPSWNTIVEDNTIRFMSKVVDVVVKDNELCNPANPKPPGARRFIERSNIHR